MRLVMKYVLFGMVLCMLFVACTLPSTTPNAAVTLQAVYTAQASTAQALRPQARASGTVTPVPTFTFPTLSHFTVSPTITPQAQLLKLTQTTQATYTPISYCDWAAFVKDVSIPDGSVVAPGGQFTKTWRLKNIGTCAWTTSYHVVFVEGNNMNGVAAISLPARISPGQTVDISIALTAPVIQGSYRGYWLLRNNTGKVFGLGAAASTPFYVDIKVAGAMTTMFDFAVSYCNATWRSGAGVLGCPGDTKSEKGYAVKVENPQLENGQIYHGAGLLVVPETLTNGYLQGYYPPFTVKKGDRFRATINCEYLAKGCNAIFRLDYQINDGPVKTIWQYAEIYEGQYYEMDTDLSSLAGNSVKFILTVLSNGSAKYDKLIWAGPRIYRPSNLVTPSVTPTVTVTRTKTMTVTPTAILSTITLTRTKTMTVTPTTSLPTVTVTPTETPTVTLPTVTVTPTETPTVTPTVIQPTVTATHTETVTVTPTY